MKKKIAIITDIGFQKKEFDMFYIKKLNKYFDIFVFDFTKITNEELYRITKEKTLKVKNYYEIKNFEKFKFLNSKFQFTTVIKHISNYDLILKIDKLFNELGMSITNIQNHYVMQVKKTFIQKLYNYIFSILDRKRLLGRLRYFFFKKKNTFFSTNIFVCGLKGLNDPSIGPKTKIIKSHSREYELHLQLFNKKNLFKPSIKYSVFLDQYLPFHTDGILIKKFNPKVTKENYFPALNDFFNFWEKKTNTKVIIAAHPKSNYDSFKHNYWYGRSCYKNKTYELIKNSKYVLGHQSTSISYAIIFNKPLIFLTSNEYMRSYDSFTVHGYAKYFQQPLFNINAANDYIFKNTFKKINKKIYSEYFNNYIKFPDSSDLNIATVFKDFFKNNILDDSEKKA